MLISEAIQKAFLHAQRKATPPPTTSTKYTALLAIADSMQKLWASEPSTDWDSLYELVTLAAVVSTTDTYALTNTIDRISKRDGDYILLDNGTNKQAVTLVDPGQLYEYRDQLAVARIGSNLKFSKAFLSSDSSIGSSIKVPAIKHVPDVTAASETVAVDRPMWLAYMMAAEFVRNDPVKQGQYDNLLGLAELEMQKMKENNGGTIDSVGVMPNFVMGESW